MAVLQDLPIELLQGIFAFTQTDAQPTTLIACAAVSRLWREVALPQLFSILKTSRSESFTDVVHFLSTHPHIAACVKHLSLGRTGSIRTLSDLRNSRPSPVVDHQTAHALLKCLPALQELSFHGVKFVGPRVAEPLPPSSLVSQPPSTVPSPPATADNDALGEDQPRPYYLQRVVLDRCVIGNDPTPLFRILSLCDIDTFQLVACAEFPDQQVLEPETLRATLRARRLWLGLHSRWGLTRALQRHLEPGCVRELSIGCDNRESLESAGALLQDVGRNLTTLKLRLSWGISAVKNTSLKWCAALNLSACTALETFYLLPYGLVMDRTGMSPGGMCADMVWSLAPSVRTIILRLYADGVESKGEEIFGLENLDEVVMKNKQKRLRDLDTVMLQFALCKEGQFEGWLSTSRKAMPRLEGAGILRVTRDG